MNSFNHYAYGAIGEWLHRTVAGLRMEATERGGQRLVIHPRPGGGLTRASADLQTPWGRAAVSWALADGNLVVEATVPPNGTARLTLPGATGAELRQSPVRFRDSPAGSRAAIGSGTYRFQYRVG